MENFSVVLCCLFGVLSLVTAESGYFTPRSYYVIDKNGQKSDVVYLTPRVKREIFDKVHLIRKRSTDSNISSPKCRDLSTSVNIASGPPPEFQNFIAPPPPDFANFFAAFFRTFPNAVYFAPQNNGLYANADLASRFGGEELSDSGQVENVPGISVSSRAQGPHGSWSSSSSSIDSNGKATYDVKSGKFK